MLPPSSSIVVPESFRSKRVWTSRRAWSTAFTSSWRLNCETTSNEDSPAAIRPKDTIRDHPRPPGYCTSRGRTRRRTPRCDQPVLPDYARWHLRHRLAPASPRRSPQAHGTHGLHRGLRAGGQLGRSRSRQGGWSRRGGASGGRPPAPSQEQVNQTNKRLIDESKPVAAVVALRAAGYPVDITGQGAEVESLIEGMPAQGVLQVGDIIVAVDGQPVDTTNSLIQAITRHRVGDQVTLTIRRDGQTQDIQVGTRSSPSDPGRPIVGVTISTYLFDVRMPFPVDVESDNVGGPSAGLMFALGILDAVTDGDLTRGYFVAGTGTLDGNGVVGPIGGAAEKALAAEQDGAQVFLVPRDNYSDARRWIHS